MYLNNLIPLLLLIHAYLGIEDASPVVVVTLQGPA